MSWVAGGSQFGSRQGQEILSLLKLPDKQLGPAQPLAQFTPVSVPSKISQLWRLILTLKRVELCLHPVCIHGAVFI
jgi:hypothetical protein